MNKTVDSVTGRRFQPAWRLTLFAAVMLPVLVGLGTWQWLRALEKQALIEADTQAAGRAVLSLTAAPVGPDAAGRKLRFRARYLAAPRVLLDNRTYQGRAGYEVHAVAVALEAHDGEARAALVNLGWVPWGADRGALPDVPLPATPVIIEGVARTVDAPVVFGASAPADAATWPLRVQSIDLSALGARIGRPLYPYVIEARVPTPGLQVPLPSPTDDAFGPDRHRAYAVQWWGLALVLAVGWMLASWRREAPAARQQQEDRT